MTNPSHECPGRNTHRFQPNNEQPPFITKSRVNSSQSNPFQGNVPVEHRLKGTKGESTPKPYYGKKSIIPENDAINIWKEHAILTKSRVNSNNLNPLAKQTYLSCARNQRRDNSYNPTMVKNPSRDAFNINKEQPPFYSREKQLQQTRRGYKSIRRAQTAHPSCPPTTKPTQLCKRDDKSLQKKTKFITN